MHTLLRFHLPYRCRDSGACCSSGWPIPVEAPLFRTLDEAMASGRLAAARQTGPPAFVEADLPPEYARVLAMDAHGACVFHDATHRRCAIHQALGPAAKPLSCRAFPFIVVRDPRGVSVSLSHYCPSAVDLLFAEGPIELVDRSGEAGVVGPGGEDAAATTVDLEGLDARDALPPPLREDVLFDWEGLTAWEQHVAGLFERAASPEAALELLERSSRALQSWRAADGPLARHVEHVGTRDLPAASGAPRTGRQSALIEAVRSAIPEPLRPPSPRSPSRAEQRQAEETVQNASRPLRRYLAARAHACWPLHQGAHGVRSQLVSLEGALACVHALLPATGDLREAIRRTDLWLIHLASPSALAASLDSLLPPPR